MSSSRSIQVSLEQAQTIVDKHCSSAPQSKIISFKEAQDLSLSSLTSTRSYAIHTAGGSPYLLKVAPLPPSSPSTYSPNTLGLEYDLAQKLSKFEGIPQPSIIAFDPSLSTIPYPYLLLNHPRGITLAQTRASNKLTDRQSLILDLRLGGYFKRIHDELQNDWFGLPSQERDELYSWQEAFTYQLETVLQDVQDLGEVLPHEDIRKYLSRAIGFFLFDDCEVPSLVSFLGDEDSIIIDFDPTSPSQSEDIPITSVFSLSHALWGDPLLETMFVNASPAFLEGYGGSPVVFARQKTKRMWYTLFQALVVLLQSHRLREADTGTPNDRSGWARETVGHCVRYLENAPCY